MKVSRYTFCFDWGDDELYIYNTLSNALLKVDRESFGMLQTAQKEHTTLCEFRMDPELWEVLTKKIFITDNDTDDLLIYKSLILPLREQKDFMHLTLAPTMECNFRCFYCFESEKPKGKMTPQTMDAIIKYVSSLPELKKIYLTWFGGEPLLAIAEMELFYDKFSKIFTKEYDSNLITTGYYLSEETIPILQRLRISSIQITLDGNKERHNKIKHSAECEDVFSRVLSNVDTLTQTAPEISVAFRINITRQNAEEYVSLQNLLYQRYEGKNISVSPGFVENRNNTDPKGNCYFTREEKARFTLDLWNKNKVYTPWLRYPKALCNECAIRDHRAVSFDPEGYVYKCWEMIGKRKYAIGKMDNEGKITHINRLLLNRQLYGSDPIEDPQCRICPYLPICDGGCPIQRIQNEFENAQNDVCISYRDHLEEFMKIHVALTKAGVDNHS